MTLRARIHSLAGHDGLNFLLTNRIPRRLLTRFVGWFSKIEQPLVRDLSIAVWRYFSDLDLGEAKHTGFRSMHDCFTRELKDGARPIDADPAILVSPCDAIVGACGRIEDTLLYQVKGAPYSLAELLGNDTAVAAHRKGLFVTLRLTSSMYHRFHAPHDGRHDGITYNSGDTWNVNPPALRRVAKLFCKNERAVIRTRLAAGDHAVTLVAVAAVLVASIRLHAADVLLHLKYRGPNAIPCATAFTKGQELGWFEHGSTIIVLAPPGFRLCDGIADGARIRMGEPLLRLPAS